jgi:excisionase family DNA binding protein
MRTNPLNPEAAKASPKATQPIYQRIVLILTWFLRLLGNPEKADRKVRECPPPASMTHSLQETAALLGVHPSTVYRLVGRKLIRPVPGLRHLRFQLSEIQRFMNGEDPRR